jgi:hypothetical protein
MGVGRTGADAPRITGRAVAARRASRGSGRLPGMRRRRRGARGSRSRHPGGDFQETKTQRCELGSGQFPDFGNGVAHGQALRSKQECPARRLYRQEFEPLRRNLKTEPGHSSQLESPKGTPGFRSTRLDHPEIRNVGARRTDAFTEVEFDDGMPLWRKVRQPRSGRQLWHRRHIYAAQSADGMLH